MSIIYTEERNFTAKDLEELYLSVEWFSGKYPDRLVKALNNCETVYSAWDNGRLIGLINAIDDGELTAYVHYRLVNPDYKGKGIGKQRVMMVKEKYKDYLTLLLLAENTDLIKFYEKLGFEIDKGATPLEILNK